MNKTKNLIVRIDEDVKKKVETLAKKSKRTVSDYTRLLIEHAIEKDLKM